MTLYFALEQDKFAGDMGFDDARALMPTRIVLIVHADRCFVGSSMRKPNHALAHEGRFLLE